MPQEQSQMRERTRQRVEEPRHFKVIFYNDDFTTMEFVVQVLMQVFFKERTEAERLMLLVHHTGKAVVGSYTFDVATSKVQKATTMAREAGFPLRVSCEPEQ